MYKGLKSNVTLPTELARRKPFIHIYLLFTDFFYATESFLRS